MPFKRNLSRNIANYTSTKKLFIGRNSEQHFFVEHILKPEEPSHNVISISGQGGVGKSTLLTHFIEKTCTPAFYDYCLTAIVDERQITPASVMEKFAEQLNITGEFEKALKQYKEALRKLQNERESLRDIFLRKAVTQASSSVAKSIPVVGGLLEKEIEPVVEYVAGEIHYHQLLKDAKRLEDPLRDLTEAFVEELNRLTNTLVALTNHKEKRLYRVILFFDTFEQVASEIAPWLLDYFLPEEINPDIILVIAGRDSIERSTPGDPKRWLPYRDNGTIHVINLESFTEKETHSYLTERGITDEKSITTIWHLSGGLPLYLSLLTFDSHGNVDPTADVVDNFLRWIPEQEYDKRQLALDVALFSRPFNQDDLDAFKYVQESQEGSASLYRWLIRFPFVKNTQDGRHSYHELAQELFSRHLYQRSKKEYYAIRKTLASYYESILQGEDYNISEKLELTLALAYQLFFLRDDSSNVKAIELIVAACHQFKQNSEIVRTLHKLSQEQHQNNEISLSTRHTTRILLQYIENATENEKFVIAVHNLLAEINNKAAFSPKLLAQVYTKSGEAYQELKEYQQAIADYSRVIELNPTYVFA